MQNHKTFNYIGSKSAKKVNVRIKLLIISCIKYDFHEKKCPFGELKKLFVLLPIYIARTSQLHFSYKHYAYQSLFLLLWIKVEVVSRTKNYGEKG